MKTPQERVWAGIGRGMDAFQGTLRFFGWLAVIGFCAFVVGIMIAAIWG